MKKNKGITLIALVITIIVLLILAGVSLNLIAGNDGILRKATSAVNKNKEETAKELVELLITDYQAEFYEKKYINGSYGGTSQEFILEKLRGGVSTGDYYVQLDDEMQDGFLNVYEGNEGTGDLLLLGMLQENGTIEWEEKINGISVRYHLNPSNDTNGNIMLTIKANSINGSISSIQSPLPQNEDGTYVVTENGEYEFTITDSSGASRTKMISIHKIDRILPPDFEPTITNITEKGFTIEANAVDNESGIGKYEYYIGEEKYESTKGSYTIDTLQESTEYSIVVKVYDRAGNSKSSAEIKQITKEGYVDYEGYINKHMQVDKKIYISSNYGNDIEGNGTQDKPYATLDKIAEKDIIEKGYSYAVVLMNGEYELTEKIFELSCDECINILGNKQKTNLTCHGFYPNSGGGSTEYEVALYRLRFEATNGGGNSYFLNTKFSMINVAWFCSEPGYASPSTFLTSNCYEFRNCTLYRGIPRKSSYSSTWTRLYTFY